MARTTDHSMARFERHTPEELIGPLNEVEKKHAPPILYVGGNPDWLENRARVSVVGTRKPTLEGVGLAKAVTEALVDRGIVVVSGLAQGIDTVAHTTAIELGGRTIAVLGTPLGVAFPPSNADLLARIIREHLAISQFGEGTPPKRGHFPVRNRTMALLSDATIIIEAGEGSGTLHQGWEALRLGRPLFILESLAHRRDLTWPAEMVGYGAQILSRENLRASLEEIPDRSRGEPAF